MRAEVHRSGERGRGEHGWLHARHSFSFADYYSPERNGFGSLLVLNEDVIEPGEGFGTHGHSDMEIVTVVLDGKLRHEDSMGNTGVIRAGEVQRMSAGTGVMHSEVNGSGRERVHLLQIWITPAKKGIKPSYEQASFRKEERKNKLVAVVSNSEDGALAINQDAEIFIGSLGSGISTVHRPKKGHGAYIFVTGGKIEAAGSVLEKGDAVAASGAKEILIRAEKGSEFIVIETPMGMIEWTFSGTTRGRGSS